MPQNHSHAGFVTDTSFWFIEQRCRLKAEAAHWAANRGKSDETAPNYQELIAKGKSAGCFLWMCNLTYATPTSSKACDDVAGCFDALADAVSVLKKINIVGSTKGEGDYE